MERMDGFKKVRVIFITDGDKRARRVIETVARGLGLRCISASAGNPTPLSGWEIVNLLQEVPSDPVLIMFDDKGKDGQGQGEMAMRYVASHSSVQVLGAVAVAANTYGGIGVPADICITAQGYLVDAAVDKHGKVVGGSWGKPIVHGDTVDILNDLNVPYIVGIGDIGKMDSADELTGGAPITRQAIETILKRSGGGYESRIY